MGVTNALIKVAEQGGQQAIQKASSDVLRNAITDVIAKNSIDLATKGFGKQILSGLRNKVFNSPASEAQALVDAFPKLYRTDFGVDGNDMITQLKNDGGAVLSGYAKFDNVDTGKGTRRLGISRDSFDRFFKRPENSFLANPKMEVGGSPRTGELYPNNQLRNAEDVLSDLRNRVLGYYTSDPANEELINSIPNIYGADEYASGLLEEIAKSNSPISSINEFKMSMGPRDISSISDMDFGNTRQLINDVPLTLANGETINVPANSLFGNFDGIREQLYDVSKGMTTNGGYKYSGVTLPKEALKNNPRAAIYNKLVEDYGPEKTRGIMAYYGGDIGKSSKSGQNSFLGKLLTGEEVENPLVIYHGVGTNKLKEILDITEETSNEYAIPNPSLQVVNPNVNAGSSYGDVILLGNKSIPGGINPYTGGPDYGSKYNLYNRDIYSPRKPNIEYKNGIPTISGTRKLATPQNISDYMNKQGAKAVESNWATPGSMAATQSQRLKNPLEAIKNSDMIKAQEELDEIFENWDRELDGGISKFLDKYMEKNPDANRFSVHDYIAEEIQNAMAGGPAWEGDPYGIWTDEGRNVVADLKKKAANLPTAYFEAKANRAVPLREFGGAILPEGYADDRVLNALDKSGISVLGYYDPNNYQESVKSVLSSLIKDKDRFNTPYMMSKTEPDMMMSKNGPSLTEMANRIKAMNKAKDLDSGIKRIGNSEVAEIDANTLPAGYEKVKKYLGSSDAERIENATGANLDKDSIEEYTSKLKKFLEEEGYDSNKTGAELLRDVRAVINEKMTEDLGMEGSTLYKDFFQTRGRLQKDNPLAGVGPSSFTISADKDKLYQTDAAKLDAEYSDRLGIGRSHVPMSDKALSSDAQGYYMSGGIGINPRYASGESGVSTIAHERMHAWQDINKGEWDSRVGDAIDELRDELRNHYHTKDEIKAYRKSGSDIDYYADHKEQEARMLQSYLDNEGFTKTWRKQAGEPTEWGDEIKPAFDKFYKKLRALSKAGVALPGIAVLFGLSANGGENKEKTY